MRVQSRETKYKNNSKHREERRQRRRANGTGEPVKWIFTFSHAKRVDLAKNGEIVSAAAWRGRQQVGAPKKQSRSGATFDVGSAAYPTTATAERCDRAQLGKANVSAKKSCTLVYG